MSVETQLRSAMAEAVVPVIADHDQLVAVARRQGLGIRRRRQALGTVGIAAMVGALALVPGLLPAPGHGGATPTRVLVGAVPQSFDPADTAPITGRSTAAALLYAVGLEASGTATDFRGGVTRSTSDGIVSSAVGFLFTPDGSDAAGRVFVNVDFEPAATQAKDLSPRPPACDIPSMEDCKVTRLSDRAWLRTALDRSSYGDRRGLRRVADLVVHDYDKGGDYFRVVVSAANGDNATDPGETITRRDPVLTGEQLTAIVEQAWWGVRLPAVFTTKGATLEPFTGADHIDGRTVTSSPAS